MHSKTIIRIITIFVIIITVAVFPSCISNQDIIEPESFTADEIPSAYSIPVKSVAETDLDGDSKPEQCILTYGPTSGISSYVLTVISSGNIVYREKFTYSDMYFTEKDDKTFLHCESADEAHDFELALEHDGLKMYENGELVLNTGTVKLS